MQALITSKRITMETEGEVERGRERDCCIVRSIALTLVRTIPQERGVYATVTMHPFAQILRAHTARPHHTLGEQTHEGTVEMKTVLAEIPAIIAQANAIIFVCAQTVLTRFQSLINETLSGSQSAETRRKGQKVQQNYSFSMKEYKQHSIKKTNALYRNRWRKNIIGTPGIWHKRSY